MSREPLSRITCVVEAGLGSSVRETLRELRMPDVFVQRAKQARLEERSGPFGLGSGIRVSESRSELFRFAVPRDRERAVAIHLAERADLFLPGRGSIFAEDLRVHDGCADSCADGEFDDALLGALPDRTETVVEPHRVICCIVQRGLADALARTVLEMGLGVPVVSFGEGMGLRDKLGLLRVTIPVDKEILYLVVPERDADLAEGVLATKARLDRPGMGFIYRYAARPYALNLQVSRGRRTHAASMDQIIAAIDQVRGSSEWRRRSSVHAARRGVRARSESEPGRLVCLSIVAEEGRVGDCVASAMRHGAGGATLVGLERISREGTPGARPSSAWETCDLVFDATLVDPIMAALADEGHLSETDRSFAELTDVLNVITYAG